jgi:hypothetical protein
MAIGSSDRVAFLAWNCKPDGLRVQYSFGQLMNSVGDRVIVRYRFGETSATDRELWNLATGHKSTFVPKVSHSASAGCLGSQPRTRAAGRRTTPAFL